MSGKVYLVGAGCGDYDLITLRGKRLLEKCDAVVYDALIDKRLLDFVPPQAERIFLGKRAGKHSAVQNEINELLIDKAKQGKTVVRLKGGDPFVFGRGGEEYIAIEQAKVPCVIVPGISSCIAVPELAGIPVTHRELSRSFHVITAHTSKGSGEFVRYGAYDGTLVFLMGLGALADISKQLITGGKSPETPCAVISEGACPQQKTVRGRLDDIAELAAKSELEAPAVIVVGETAAFEFANNVQLPLSKVTIALTGTKAFARKLGAKLEALGAVTETAAELEVTEYENVTIPQRKYTWLVLTSSVGAHMLLEMLKKDKTDLRRLYDVKIATVGKATAACFEESGIYPDLVPLKYNSEALAKELSKVFAQQDRALVLRAQKGSQSFVDALTEKGIAFDDIKLYDTVGKVIIHSVTADYIVFASAYGVQSFFEGGGILSDKTVPVCIGEVTAQALGQFVKSKVLVAQQSDADGIANIIMKDREKQ